ncbi:MAG: PAS domain S-box protein [Hyphomicrobiales bacterium]|nr:PAS domain S-box protein [Hyphomicrobiales bacterium]
MAHEGGPNGRPAEPAPDDRLALLEAIERASLDAIITTDGFGRIASFNPAAERIFGRAAAEAVGRDIAMLMPEPYRSRHGEFMERYKRTGERRIIGIGRVVSGLRKNGETFPMELAIAEPAGGGGRVFVGFVRDLSAAEDGNRRVQKLQDDLFHASRLAELGQFSSSLAHEVNQPLAAIANYSEAARAMAEAGGAAPALAETLGKIERQARRAADIVKRLRAFVEKRETERRPCAPNSVVEEAAALALVGPARRRVRLVAELAPDLPEIEADRVQLQQVLVNLVRNALDAMEGGAAPEIVVATGLGPDGRVEFRVSDRGPGVAPGREGDLFKPFSTTKPRGMGVGLSISKAIVDAHGGAIRHEARPGGGATFVVSLPVEGKGAHG